MIKDGIYEVGDRFFLPCGKEMKNEIFVVVKINRNKTNTILEAICRDSEITISVNVNDVEFLGKEFHTG